MGPHLTNEAGRKCPVCDTTNNYWYNTYLKTGMKVFKCVLCNIFFTTGEVDPSIPVEEGPK